MRCKAASYRPSLLRNVIAGDTEPFQAVSRQPNRQAAYASWAKAFQAATGRSLSFLRLDSNWGDPLVPSFYVYGALWFWIARELGPAIVVVENASQGHWGDVERLPLELEPD